MPWVSDRKEWTTPSEGSSPSGMLTARTSDLLKWWN